MLDRDGWITRALIATLLGVVFAANAFIGATAIVEDYLFQAVEDPRDKEWFFDAGPAIVMGCLTLMIISMAWIAFSWGKVKHKALDEKRVKPEAKEEDDEDIFVRPPGFGETKRVRTKRAGVGGLVGFTLGGLLVTGAAVILAMACLLTLDQTITFEGLGYNQAVLFGQLLRFAAMPLAAIAGLMLGRAWGRYFPLGELEVIEETVAATKAPKRATWDRQ